MPIRRSLLSIVTKREGVCVSREEEGICMHDHAEQRTQQVLMSTKQKRCASNLGEKNAGRGFASAESGVFSIGKGPMMQLDCNL